MTLAEDQLLFAIGGLVICVPMLATICHEAGHYYAAKLCRIDAIEYSLGKGPAILRIPATTSGCTFVLRIFPFGGQVIYDDRYWHLNYLRRAFLSAAGWMTDICLATLVITTAYLTSATGPIATFICGVVGFNVLTGLLPVTSDGRKTLKYLWLAATEWVSTGIPE